MTRKTFKNIIVTPELLAQVNPENIKLRDRFLKEKNSRSSDKTITGYLSDTNIFFVWNLLYNDNKFFVDIRKLEFSEFFGYCVEELKWGSAKYSRVKSCLSSFSGFIEKFYDDIYPNFRNVILKAVENLPKCSARDKTILSESQVEFIFKSLEDEGDKQMSCWLALAIASGCRFSELLRFTTDLIDEKNIAFDGIFLETTKSIKTKGRGKAGKMLVKYIIKELFWDRYNVWLKERERILSENGKVHNYIFIKKNGDPADDSTARGWINEIQKFVDVPFYAHSLRHYATTYLSKMKIPHVLIKELFGWESVDMVLVYDDVQAKDKSWSELENLKQHLNNKPEDDSSN